MHAHTFLFESLERLSAQVELQVITSQRVAEVSWNTSDLRLPVTASATFRCEEPRAQQAGEQQAGEQQAGAHEEARLPGAEVVGTLWVEHAPHLRERFYRVTMGDCPALVAEVFGVDAARVEPRAAWRFWLDTARVRLSGEGGGVEGQALVEREVEYLHPSAGVVLAREPEVRLEVARDAAPELLDALNALPHLPVVTKYWMAEYHYKRLLRWPTHNDLPGYEYEAKLSVHHLDVHELPQELEGRFEVIERYQTESVRWYFEGVELPGLGRLEKGRVGFRGSRASLVSKGKKQKLAGGVLKRTEEKSQGLDTWSLSAVEPLALEMRRVKRQIYVVNRLNRRVYAVCLDHCEAETRRDAFIQLEIEYNGLLQIEPEEWGLSFEAQWRLARSLERRAPRAALRCCERAALFLPAEPSPPAGAAEELAALTERLRAEVLTLPAGGDVDPALEEQVVGEMNELSAALQRAYGFVPSTQTKRQWLERPPSGLPARPSGEQGALAEAARGRR